MDVSTVEHVEVGDLTLGYRALGQGPAVLLLHGWPTSSFLWREVMKPIATANRVIALDLPGFGESSKPPQASYDFAFFTEAIDGFLSALKIDRVALAGHDIGGPIAVKWALDRPARVTKLALLNTLVYPEFSEAVAQFVTACRTPELREKLTRPAGLEAAMRLGVADPDALGDDVCSAVAAPFVTEADRLALAAAGIGLEPQVFAELGQRLPSLPVPVRLIYGEQDRILPDIVQTMGRLERDVPGAELTSLPHCGHFLQEEAPEEVGDMLARFFGGAAATQAVAGDTVGSGRGPS